MLFRSSTNRHTTPPPRSFLPAPALNATDTSTAAAAVNGMVDGINRSVARVGVVLTATPGRLLRLGGYAGRRYLLDASPASGEVRVLSKQIGDEREIFLICVLNAPYSETTGTEFLNSFKIRGTSEQKAVSSRQ